ncbi:MAG TPA: GspE/PulE family protein [Rectinemataceae bacterium]|nr:GspE/PulE family protein [Rectinemataceae bacterium]
MKAVAMRDFTPLPAGKDQYPLEYIEANGAVKLREAEGLVQVGLVSGVAEAVKDALRSFHAGRELRLYEIDRTELAAYVGSAASEAPGGAESGELPSEDRVFLDALADGAPIVNLVNSICIEAIRDGASDIHLEAHEAGVRVRYRLDGTLRTVRTLDAARFPALSSRIKIMAKLNIMERRLPQDGRITVAVGGRNVDLRVSIVPIARGESIVLRVFDGSGAKLSLGELGFAEDHVGLVRRLLRIPHGLALVTGPTGSGKTTTLNAMLRELASERLKIVTIEDPVECIVEGASQIQTNDQIKLGFDTILRRVLRQDPDVIMVGEIRDAATAELAVRAALTGHLVLSTLHTNGCVSAIPRLRNMGIEPYLVASVLQGAIAQRLVRRLCPACARRRPLGAAEARLFAAHGVEAEFVFEACGCELCRGTGYRSRTAVAEMFLMDGDLEELILRNERASRIAARLEECGFRGLARDGLLKAAAGLTSLGELETELAL